MQSDDDCTLARPVSVTLSAMEWAILLGAAQAMGARTGSDELVKACDKAEIQIRNVLTGSSAWNGKAVQA